MERPGRNVPIMTRIVDVPSAYTIFCDDIRREDNGKLIIVGMYVGTMVYNVDAPQIASIYLILHYVEPMNFSEEPVRFEISRSSQDIPILVGDVLPLGPRQANIGEDLENRLLIAAPIKLPPQTFEGPETIRVRWYCGDDVVHAGSLKVEFAPSAPTIAIDPNEGVGTPEKT